MTAENGASPDGGFATLGLDVRLLSELSALGYEEPTPIQRQAIPPLLAGRDLLGQAATGTGKTAAFALPMLQLLARDDGRAARTSALILVPTRELAMQVAQAVHRYGKGLGVRVLPIYGGQAIGQQLRALKRGVDIVIATPGRALDHIRRGTLDLSGVRVTVLDEADEMLDMGFADELEAILGELPEERQTALFSATIPPRIAAIAERHLRNPERVRIAAEAKGSQGVARVRQVAYMVPRVSRTVALGRVLDAESPTRAIVFCRTRNEVDELTETLAARGYSAEALHGGMAQEQRDRVMRRFRDGTSEFLVATDVAARGLDIEDVTHVVNYGVPNEPEAYIHRIGRTGRAGREGVAITFAEPRERRLLRNIERATHQRIEIATVPTVADLRARRLELIQAALHEALVSGEYERHRVVAEGLAEEFDITDVAAAAVWLVDEATGGEQEETEEMSATAAEAEPMERTGGGGKRSARQKKKSPERRAGRRQPEWDVARLFVGAGRTAGVRPGDLVGAIANEVGIDSSMIGSIEISDRFSLVEVPDEIADEIISALRASTIKGRRVTVRRDRAEQ
ncbi:MAG TPA: DEAD/DEAH box helicase [Gemmatimonadaceae bacterium]|nr:DEAD/DEAH box helicase [Gemmatimonadaceae bacterium]